MMDEAEEVDDVNVERPTKRKSKNPDQYKRNKIKAAKLTGSPHVNHRNKEVPALVVGEPCK